MEEMLGSDYREPSRNKQGLRRNGLGGTTHASMRRVRHGHEHEAKDNSSQEENLGKAPRKECSPELQS